MEICKECNRKFSSKNSLRSHQSRFHRGQNKEKSQKHDSDERDEPGRTNSTNIDQGHNSFCPIPQLSSVDEAASTSPTSQTGPSNKRPADPNRYPITNVRSYKYMKIIRKKADRAKLEASTCKSCVGYYKACGLSNEKTAELLSEIGRHRYQHGNGGRRTPDHEDFWALEITKSPPRTQSPSPPKARRRNKYMRNWEEHNY